MKRIARLYVEYLVIFAITVIVASGVFSLVAPWRKRLSFKVEILEILIRMVETVVGEALGFAALGLVIVYFLRRHLVEAFEKGLRYVGDKLSRDFVTYIIPEIQRAREAAEVAMAVAPKPFSPSGEIVESINEDLTDNLKEVQKLISESNFSTAEGRFKAMLADNPTNFNVLKAFFELYLLPNNERYGDALKVLLNSEEHFKNNPRFYHLLARIFMVMKSVIDPSIAKRDAYNAAVRATELEPANPKWTKLVGFVHYWFSEIDPGITLTEKALRMAMTQNNETEITSCKNNLAYYWAMQGIKKDKAFEYALEVNSHDENNPNYLDTLGFVHLQFAESKEDLRKATGFFAKALEFAPNDADILYLLKEASKRLEESP
jgi:tetratricopeptide (TPR) repeat protein